VHLSNTLLRSTWLLALELYCAGGFAVVEHPARPVWEERAASSWQLPEVRAILRLPLIDSFEFDQCTLGQYARKPTCLASVRLPMLRSYVCWPNGGRCRHAPGTHATLRGRRADGSYLTFNARTYPSQMCLRLALAIREHILRSSSLPYENANSFDFGKFQAYFQKLD
jgi:hypothetical protein